MTKHSLSDRAKHRLRIVAGLLRGTGKKKRDLNLSRENFYQEIQILIENLSDDDKKNLKENTDWVESYDNEIKRNNNAQGA